MALLDPLGMYKTVQLTCDGFFGDVTRSENCVSHWDYFMCGWDTSVVTMIHPLTIENNFDDTEIQTIIDITSSYFLLVVNFN